MSQTFAELGLTDDSVRAISALGPVDPTPVQQQVIPPVLAGRDLLAEVTPGTGVTASFVWPLLQRLRADVREPGERGSRVLVLAPTRELAIQAEDCARQSAGDQPLRTALLFGGVSPQPQVQALAPGVELLAATPRRLLDHLGQATVDLSGVETLVVNVGERVLDTGFLRDVERIAESLPGERQVLVFAAALTPDIEAFAARLARNPERLQCASGAAGDEAVEAAGAESAERRDGRRPPRGPSGGNGRNGSRRGAGNGNGNGLVDGNFAPTRERQAGMANGNVASAEDFAPRREPRNDRQPASNENQLFPSSGSVYGHGPGQGARRNRRSGRGGGQPSGNGYPYRD